MNVSASFRPPEMLFAPFDPEAHMCAVPRKGSTMRRLLTLTMLLTLLATLVPISAAAQDWDPCGDALNDVYPDGYKVVWAPQQGGAGSQIVLGTDGDDYLKGGSGHDILCGYGGNDVLEGNSGNDWLDAGTGSNELYGNSGNDTLIGMEGDVFVGSSGHNEIVVNTAPIDNCALASSFNYGEGITPDLSGLDLSGCVFDNDHFQYANFAGSDLSGATLEGDYDYANFSGANLSGAYIICACTGLDLSGANLSGAYIANGGFQDSDLSGADFSYARLESFSTLRSNQSGANFTGAELEHVTFWNDLTYANFTNASFNFTSFVGADLTGADFTGATFSVVSWTVSTCPDGTASASNGDTCLGHLTP
jgi:uncharacterized protein YjbI with pentapeptide repeats